MAATVVVFHLIALVSQLAARSPPPISVDAALFEHAGWYLHEGATIYVDIWDLKPPLAYELPWLFATLTGGSPLGIHALSVLVTTLAGVGFALVLAELVHRATGDAEAALLAGLVALTLPGLVLTPALGFRPKLIAIALGLGALLIRETHPAWAGAAVAASAGLWQMAVVFPGIVFAASVVDRWREGLLRHAVGAAGVTALVLLPVVLQGATVAMLVEAVLVPLMTPEPLHPLLRGGRAILETRWALPILVVGAAGLLAAMPRWRDRWPLLAIGAWGGLQLLVDLDGVPDLFLPVAGASLGLGLLAARLEGRPRGVLAAGLGLAVLVSALGPGGFGIVYDPITKPAEEQRADPALVHAFMQRLHGSDGGGDDGDAGVPAVLEPVERSRFYGGDNMAGIFWNQVTPTPCHYRFSKAEVLWLERTDQTFLSEPCGRWPSDLL